MRAWIGIFLIVLTVAAQSVGAQPGAFRFQVGDDVAWATPSFDDSEWSYDQPRLENRWWCRAVIDVREIDPDESLHLRASMLGAWELYLDGQLVGTNGTLGSSKETEVPGRYVRAIPIDRALWTPGRHLLAFRVSSFHTDRISGYHGCEIVDLDAHYLKELPTTVLFMSLAGILLFAAVFFLLFYFVAERRASTILLGLLSGSVATLLALEFAKYFYHYPYHLHRVRLVFISFDTVLIGILLPAFLMSYASIPKKRWILGLQSLVVVGIMLLVSNFDHSCLYMQRETIALSIVLVIWGLWNRRPGLWLVLLGICGCFVPMLFTGFRFADRWIFLGFVFVVLLLVLETMRTVARRYRERQEALLRASSLRYELLRRRIQPHFLMNSLAAAISWIEENPARGIEMLRTLARELQAFFQISDRPAIPASEELELCRLHTSTMGYMLDRPIGFEVDAPTLDGDVWLPPGILLTLVENAITHGQFDVEGAVIGIRHESSRTGRAIHHCYVVSNPIAPDSNGPDPEGQGIAYIRSRLEEAFGNSWSIEAESEGGIWSTSVRFESVESNLR